MLPAKKKFQIQEKMIHMKVPAKIHLLQPRARKVSAQFRFVHFVQ
jgi:hypothetical protein